MRSVGFPLGHALPALTWPCPRSLLLFVDEADAFLRTQIDQETYQKIMGHEAGRAHPYVAARIVMDNEQWEKYLWISHHGSLAGCSLPH